MRVFKNSPLDITALACEIINIESGKTVYNLDGSAIPPNKQILYPYYGNDVETVAAKMPFGIIVVSYDTTKYFMETIVPDLRKQLDVIMKSPDTAAVKELSASNDHFGMFCTILIPATHVQRKFIESEFGRCQSNPTRFTFNWYIMSFSGLLKLAPTALISAIFIDIADTFTYKDKQCTFALPDYGSFKNMSNIEIKYPILVHKVHGALAELHFGTHCDNHPRRSIIKSRRTDYFNIKYYMSIEDVYICDTSRFQNKLYNRKYSDVKLENPFQLFHSQQLAHIPTRKECMNLCLVEINKKIAESGGCSDHSKLSIVNTIIKQRGYERLPRWVISQLREDAYDPETIIEYAENSLYLHMQQYAKWINEDLCIICLTPLYEEFYCVPVYSICDAADAPQRYFGICPLCMSIIFKEYGTEFSIGGIRILESIQKSTKIYKVTHPRTFDDVCNIVELDPPLVPTIKQINATSGAAYSYDAELTIVIPNGDTTTVLLSYVNCLQKLFTLPTKYVLKRGDGAGGSETSEIEMFAPGDTSNKYWYIMDNQYEYEQYKQLVEHTMDDIVVPPS
jgi:hypothetical protein